jgi:hypothetical protein
MDRVALRQPIIARRRPSVLPLLLWAAICLTFAGVSDLTACEPTLSDDLAATHGCPCPRTASHPRTSAHHQSTRTVEFPSRTCPADADEHLAGADPARFGLEFAAAIDRQIEKQHRMALALALALGLLAYLHLKQAHRHTVIAGGAQPAGSAAITEVIVVLALAFAFVMLVVRG